jgi:hypothetical protein
VITEYIGPTRFDIAITFVDPADWGLDTSRFAAAGVHRHACGDVFLQRPPLRVGTMIHVIRDTHDGFELRSRYWLGDEINLSVAGRSVPLAPVTDRLGITRRLTGASLAYEQLLHDQIEFTHLATFLAQIYSEFANL